MIAAKRLQKYNPAPEERERMSERMKKYWEHWRLNPTRLYVRPLLHPIKIQHGTNTGYGIGCRCKECTNAHRLVAREYTQQKRAVILEGGRLNSQAPPAPNKKRLRQNEKPRNSTSTTKQSV
jgi:hypothetical protein